MFIESINWWTIASASIASFVIGGLWYSPLLFGQLWMKLTGIKKEDVKNPAISTVGMLFVVIVATFGLDYLLFAQNITDLGEGAGLAFILWLVIVLPVMSTAILFEMKDWRLQLLNSGYQLTIMVLSALILVHFA